jgi:hypothetical protein
VRTNRINAPLSYREAGQVKPVKTERPVPAPRIVRVYICVHCRKGWGTLKNIGTHKAPRYVHHPPCKAMKELEAKATGRS